MEILVGCTQTIHPIDMKRNSISNWNVEKQVVPKKKRRAGARSYTPLAFSFRDCSEKKINKCKRWKSNFLFTNMMYTCFAASCDISFVNRKLVFFLNNSWMKLLMVVRRNVAISSIYVEQVGLFGCCSVGLNFLEGREITLQCSYPSSWFISNVLLPLPYLPFPFSHSATLTDFLSFDVAHISQTHFMYVNNISNAHSDFYFCLKKFINKL